jgi:hypothetical protein
MDQNEATGGVMQSVNQEEEALEPMLLINNDRQDDGDSLSEEVGKIYTKLEEELVVNSRTPEQFSYK